jgi:hypothetical protein
MLKLEENQKVFVAIAPVDFRQGIDRLKQYCKDQIKRDPQSGAMFIFKNKRNFSIKILFYDGEAFWLCMRRLSRGKIPWWPVANGKYRSLSIAEVNKLLGHQSSEGEVNSEDWKKLIQ